MRKIAFVLVLLTALSCSARQPLQPIYPPMNDMNWLNTRTNFESFYTAREDFTNGVTSEILSFPCGTTSVVLATLNTNSGNYITAVLTGDNTVEVVLDSAASDTLEVSLFTIIDK